MPNVNPFQSGIGGILTNPMAPQASNPAAPMSNGVFGLPGSSGAPPLPSYNPSGGYVSPPLGNYWNNIAQQMAGPMPTLTMPNAPSSPLHSSPITNAMSPNMTPGAPGQPVGRALSVLKPYTGPNGSVPLPPMLTAGQNGSFHLKGW